MDIDAFRVAPAVAAAEVMVDRLERSVALATDSVVRVVFASLHEDALGSLVAKGYPVSSLTLRHGMTGFLQLLVDVVKLILQGIAEWL
jgi:hypothetical protein